MLQKKYGNIVLVVFALPQEEKSHINAVVIEYGLIP